MKHRLFAWLLIFVMTAGLLCVPAAAISTDNTAGAWKYELRSDGICLTEYAGTDAEVTVPAVLNGQPVTAIGSGCFRGNEKLTEVVIEHGVRIIGQDAFRGCAALKKVRISGSINEIGDRAFSDTGLGSAVIPGSVRSIGAEAFCGCTRLYDIVIEEGVEEWSVGEPEGEFGPGSVTLVEGIETIGQKAFYGCVNLTRMRVPATVVSLGAEALAYTDEGLISGYQITGAAGSEAERYAIENNIDFVALEEENGDSGLCGEAVSWSFDGSTLTISGTGRMYDYAAAERLPWYDLRSRISCAVIDEGVTSLGEYIFSDSAVSDVTLPRTLEVVGKEAFGGCAALKEITFPGDAPRFAEDAFLGTTVMARYPGENGTWTVDVQKDYGGDVAWRVEGSHSFADVQVGSFYYDPVMWALENGITTGTDSSHFSPLQSCDRAQAVIFLWRVKGRPAPQGSAFPFVDVAADAFYRDAVLWAVEERITTGTGNHEFGPFLPCSRAQIVTLLWRSMGSPEPASLDTPFVDVDPGIWYGPAVAWAVEQGITTGISDDCFGVYDVCNRAQMVTFLYRAFHK